MCSAKIEIYVKNGILIVFFDCTLKYIKKKNQIDLKQITVVSHLLRSQHVSKKYVLLNILLRLQLSLERCIEDARRNSILTSIHLWKRWSEEKIGPTAVRSL